MHSPDYKTDPLSGPFGAMLKFIGAALFGCFVSLIVFVVLYFAMGFRLFEMGGWLHLLWVIPLAWGILGIFWFDRMLDLGRSVFEGYFGVDSEDE